MILKSLCIIYLRSDKITFSVSVVVGKFVSDSNGGIESLSVLSLCMFKTVKLLNRSWFIPNGAMILAFRQSKRIFHRLHWLPDLRKIISLHNVITYLIIKINFPRL